MEFVAPKKEKACDLARNVQEFMFKWQFFIIQINDNIYTFFKGINMQNLIVIDRIM